MNTNAIFLIQSTIGHSLLKMLSYYNITFNQSIIVTTVPKKKKKRNECFTFRLVGIGRFIDIESGKYLNIHISDVGLYALQITYRTYISTFATGQQETIELGITVRWNIIASTWWLEAEFYVALIVNRSGIWEFVCLKCNHGLCLVFRIFECVHNVCIDRASEKMQRYRLVDFSISKNLEILLHVRLRTTQKTYNKLDKKENWCNYSQWSRCSKNSLLLTIPKL